MNEDTANTITGAAGAATGFGIVTMALFPFLIPLLLITLAFVLPLALLALPLVPLVAAGFAIRALVRRRRRSEGEEQVATDERRAPRPRPYPARG
jgi:hypothetical protein